MINEQNHLLSNPKRTMKKDSDGYLEVRRVTPLDVNICEYVIKLCTMYIYSNVELVQQPNCVCGEGGRADYNMDVVLILPFCS